MKKIIKYVSLLLVTICMASCNDAKFAEPLSTDNDELTIQHNTGMNVVGRVTVDGVPRQGVVVSDGVNVITTDEKGEYQMRSKNRDYVFISVPADCELPTEQGLPKFFKKLNFTNSHVLQRNFELKSKPIDSKFTIVALADVQVGDNVDLSMLDTIMPKIKAQTDSIQGTVIGMSMGDISWNNTGIYGQYKAQVSRLSFPTLNIIGNHDHNEKTHDDINSDKEYRDALGPTYYSYNIGQWHIIAIDDVLYSGVRGRNDYEGEITRAQLAWLKKDLEYVSKDKSIIIGLHIPTSRRNNPNNHITNRQDLYNLIKDYHRVIILSGHTHNNFTTDIAPNMREYTLGAVMGAYWNTYGGLGICNDGSPRGYGVFSFDGNELSDSYYRGEETPRDYQVKAYAPKEASMRYGRIEGILQTPYLAIPTHFDNSSVLINVFNWHTDWTVQVQEDNGQWQLLTNSSVARDPLAVRFLQYRNGWEKRPSADPEDRNDHMFFYNPTSSNWQTINVKATDPWGRIYTASTHSDR
ncbi:MAG: calcineurin-like phosphoesterase C-terminal domain-containing protein [Prevotellaceae bacterium]|nr:calcineurin-like phosphoesterase C-terminal domain-containing protein [Prevotellaceae bacterium]